jgi:flagellar biosynthetic protein FliQ
MTPDQAIHIVRESLMVALMISTPILGVGLAVGLVVSIFQAVTQIQEQTLSFVPKIMGMALVAILIVPWAYVKMAEFATRMFAP